MAGFTRRRQIAGGKCRAMTRLALGESGDPCVAGCSRIGGGDEAIGHRVSSNCWRAKAPVVRATDLKPLDQLPEAAAIARRACIFPSRMQTPEVFEGAELIVLSPGCACGSSAARGGAAARCSGHWRDRTGRAVS